MKALQAGIMATNSWGRVVQRRAFTSEEGYFPVSRMVSTFPSASDVAWTDIFGDRPLPGYQRTYYSVAPNSMVSINGVTTTMEHERQMDWQVQNGFLRTLGYLCPAHTFRYEMRGMDLNFWKSTGDGQPFYVYLRASDDAQHLDRDILGLLCELDQRIQKMRARYKAREGRDLEIVILSDHGHNHAGRGQRVDDVALLEKAGYRIAKSITSPKDVVLPICGIESWVEVHCDPSETVRLAALLCRLKGADVLAATLPNQTNRFLVMNSRGERADIEWNRAGNSFRYSPVDGDPIHYRPVVEALARDHQLDAQGFATADAWMAATMTNYYPLAPERIVRGLTHAALNPATILISLDNHYVNAGWLTERGSRLVDCGSTHGGLDAICSDGILLSNFQPTRDTASDRVAAQFGNFSGVRNFRAEEGGGEFVTRSEQALVRISHVPFDRGYEQLSGGEIYLRIWSPQLASQADTVAITVAIEKVPHFATGPAPLRMTFDQPMSFPEKTPNERVYLVPPDLRLERRAEYHISGWIQDRPEAGRLLEFVFHTDGEGRPAPY
jgi:hypothetical protein